MPPVLQAMTIFIPGSLVLADLPSPGDTLYSGPAQLLVSSADFQQLCQALYWGYGCLGGLVRGHTEGKGKAGPQGYGG